MRWTSALAAAFALAPVPALADVTAQYAAGPVVLTIEADDRGDWRFDIPGECILIHRDGVDYLVLERGDRAGVFKLDDLLEAIGPAPSAKAKSEKFARVRFKMVQGAAAKVAGRNGTVWRFGPEEPGLDRDLEIVTSKDPLLAPIGAVFSSLQPRASRLLLGAVTSESNLPQMVAELVATGTPVRVDSFFELRSVGTQPIDPQRFALPGPVLDAALLRAKAPPPVVKTEAPLPPPPPPPSPRP